MCSIILDIVEIFI